MMRNVLVGELDAALVLDQIHADYQASIDRYISQMKR